MAEAKKQGQTVLNFQVDTRLVEAVDAALKFENRSLWIRIAIAERLRKEGYEIPDAWIQAPPRTGKGGRPRKYAKPSEKALKVAEEPEAEKVAPLHDPEKQPSGWILTETGQKIPVYKEPEAAEGETTEGREEKSG